MLNHLKDKCYLFKEVYRVLKPNSFFIINDWLSPLEEQWGERIETMCRREALTIFAETIQNYIKLLYDTGFADIVYKDESESYSIYNWNIVERLKQPEITQKFKDNFGEADLLESIDSYQLIAEAMSAKELLVTLFHSRKR